MMDQCTSTSILPVELVDCWKLGQPHFLSERVNTHWRVNSSWGAAVLRRYGSDVTENDIQYEMDLMERLAANGWPVPSWLEQPARLQGHWWALMEQLPGYQRNGPGEDRRRGRLLAEFHATTTSFPRTRRIGWAPVREGVFDQRLDDAVRYVEQQFPYNGRVLLWHLEVARERFAQIAEFAQTTVIHEDFNSRNLLFVEDRLTGILDFEATHPDDRVAEFALSWRANRDDVVLGYNEVTKLSEVDWCLLTPCIWAWAFLGVAAMAEDMRNGLIAPHGFDWQVEMLLRRSPLMGPDAVEYRPK